MAIEQVLIHGLGTEGRAAAEHFLGRPGMTVICADSVAATGPDGSVVVTEEAAMREHLARGGLYLRSPGIPPENALHRAALSAGMTVTTPTGYWLSKLAPEAAITVTGTKGKSTTTALIAAILNASGVRAAPYGNIGRPPLGPRLPEEAVPVVELSSYMMHDLPPGSYRHVVTSLYKEHTDWHGGEAPYRAAKLRPFRLDPPCEGVAPRDLIAAEGLLTAQATEDLVPCEGDRLLLEDRVVQLSALNDAFLSAAAFAAARTAAAAVLPMLGPERCAAGLERAAAAWRGLPSRQAQVPTTDGRLWIDDALATVPEATASALARFCDRPVRLILGGKDRGQDLRALQGPLAAAPRTRVYAFGPIGAKVETLLAKARPTLFETMEAAVGAAARDCPLGGVVLFSPAAPSAPPHRDFEERSALFAEIARAFGAA